LTTAKNRLITNILLRKGGVVNKVASRYVMAGFQVRVNPEIPGLDLIATKSGEAYGVRVIWEKKRYEGQVIEELLNASKKLGLKPILILYGSGPHIDKDIIEEASRKGVLVKRIRGV